MRSLRWTRIIPVALVMYTISYIDRTNVSLALDGRISSLLRELAMDDRRKGTAAGIFFFGYFLLQMPGGHFAQRWSPRKLISLCLALWGACAIACGLARTFPEFVAARFALGMAEGSVFPATMVLLANWFPPWERVRATALWCICQPIAVILSAPVTGWWLGSYGWRKTLVLEGLFPLLWLPAWWLLIRDHPREMKALSEEERDFIERTVQAEARSLESPTPVSIWRVLRRWEVLNMAFIFLCNASAAYGCMTFFTNILHERAFTPRQYGVLFAVPYCLTAVVMLLISWNSDRTGERRGHVAATLALCGACLILSVASRGHFWLAYAFLCLSIPAPFSVLGPFFAVPAETLPRESLGALIGVVSAFGNLGGFFGPYFVGWLSNLYHSTAVPFVCLGAGLALAGFLSLLLPRSKRARP